MRKLAFLACVVTGVVAACSSDSVRVERLREAVARASIPLRQSVAVAESSMADGVALKAELKVDADYVYSVGTVAARTLNDVRVDIASGAVVSSARLGASDGPCAGAVPVSRAIEIAEAEVKGAAVSVQPDDDNACDREVQVLAAKLMEVKVAPDGKVLEVEEADSD